MQEIFHEESAVVQNEKAASRKYNIVKMLSIVSYVALGVWILLCFNFYGLTGSWVFDLLFILIPAVAFFLMGFLFGRAKNRFYIDYDYTFVSGSIRISKVIKNIKRKLVIKFDTKSIEKLGKYGSETYCKYEQLPDVNKMILTSNYVPSEGKDFYYLVINSEGDKKLLVLECSEILIINIIKFSSKTILDEEFIKELSRAK